MPPKSERTYRLVKMPDGQMMLVALRRKVMPILYDSSDENDELGDTEVTRTDSNKTGIRDA